MGRKKLRLDRLEIKRFDLGYFPNMDLDEVPDGGSSDCKHVIYYQSGLKKTPGMVRVNSTQVGTDRGNGLFYLDVNGAQKQSACFATGFYENVSGTWTARTGAITLTNAADNIVQFINHQRGSNKYLIGVNGVNAPFKWTGSGNAAVLGGTPPANFTSIAKYHSTIFGSYAEIVYFSDTDDPETWDSTRWVIFFDKDVKCMLDNGQKLAVLMEDHIGSISGYDYLDFSKEETEIKNVGCVGRLAACKAFFGKDKTDVIATVSRDGIYLIDQAFGQRKILGDNYFEGFNQANLHKATIAYSNIDSLLYVALPYGSATENDYLIIIDMMNGAFWPCPNIHTTYIRALASMKDSSGDEYIYFIDTNGYSFYFDFNTKNYHTGTAEEAIDSRWKSRKIDMKDVYQVRWPMLLAQAVGNWNVNMSIGFGLSDDDGYEGSVNQSTDEDVLGSTIILGASVLGGSGYIFREFTGNTPFGRYFTVTFENNRAGESFNIKKAEIQMKRRRMGSNDK
jgi:hypothetical protein